MLIGLAWLLVAIAVGATGLGRTWPPPVVIAGLTAAVLAAAWLIPRFRAWLGGVDLRWLVAFHLTRFVGFYFLYLYARGQLPYDFAVPGGWGDIAVAGLAIVLLLIGPAGPAASGERPTPSGTCSGWPTSCSWS